MVLYGITLVTLAEEIQAIDLGIIIPFYAVQGAFYGSTR